MTNWCPTIARQYKHAPYKALLTEEPLQKWLSYSFYRKQRIYNVPKFVTIIEFINTGKIIVLTSKLYIYILPCSLTDCLVPIAHLSEIILVVNAINSCIEDLWKKLNCCRSYVALSNVGGTSDVGLYSTLNANNFTIFFKVTNQAL